MAAVNVLDSGLNRVACCVFNVSTNITITIFGVNMATEMFAETLDTDLIEQVVLKYCVSN
jgi:hypothetical protein